MNPSPGGFGPKNLNKFHDTRSVGAGMLTKKKRGTHPNRRRVRPRRDITPDSPMFHLGPSPAAPKQSARTFLGLVRPGPPLLVADRVRQALRRDSCPPLPTRPARVVLPAPVACLRRARPANSPPPPGLPVSGPRAREGADRPRRSGVS